MKNFQTWMTEEQHLYFKNLVDKARATFESDGRRFSITSTLIRVFEEWCIDRGYIDNTSQDLKNHDSKTLIRNDPEELKRIENLIQMAKKRASPGTLREIHAYILRLEPDFQFPRGQVSNKILIDKLEELVF